MNKSREMAFIQSIILLKIAIDKTIPGVLKTAMEVEYIELKKLLNSNRSEFISPDVVLEMATTIINYEMDE